MVKLFLQLKPQETWNRDLLLTRLISVLLAYSMHAMKKGLSRQATHVGIIDISAFFWMCLWIEVIMSVWTDFTSVW